MISVDEEIIHFNKIFQKKYNLNKVLDILGNPQNEIPVINVVGTNGKGSVSNVLSYGLQTKHKKVGLFISPAFLYHNERIQINNVPISDEQLLGLLKEIDGTIKKYNLTFFEIWTLIAIMYFAKENIDIAVIEAGIGGKNDTTNLFLNQVCVAVTSIDLDHTEVLGDTLEKIIEQKMGIAKPNKKIYVSVDNIKNIKLFDKFKGSNILEVTGLEEKMLGYQKSNYGLAKKVLDDLQVSFDVSLVKPPLGRMTLLNENPVLLIDGAHNEDGIKKLVSSLKESKNEYKILFATSKMKDFDSMVKYLRDNFANVYLTEFNHFKSWKIREEYRDITIKDWKKFIQDNKKENLVICGSLYFIPLVYDWFWKRDK